MGKGSSSGLTRGDVRRNACARPSPARTNVPLVSLTRHQRHSGAKAASGWRWLGGRLG